MPADTDQPTLAVTQADREFAAGWIVIAPQNVKRVLSGEWDHHHGVQAAVRHRTNSEPRPAGDLREALEAFADYHGDLPDYDHPLRPTFESGIQYAVELLAKELGVKEWVPCDGTEEFDGDLGGTLMNIVLEAMPKDEHGDPIYPRDLIATHSPAPMAGEGYIVVKQVSEDLLRTFPDTDGDGVSPEYAAGYQAAWRALGLVAAAHPSTQEGAARGEA